SRWLQQVLSGEDPGEWFAGGWSSILKEVAEATPPDNATEHTEKNDE
ncbi:hypothetical protein ACI4BE_27165, partial [Klebsiella pneumoniae]